MDRSQKIASSTIDQDIDFSVSLSNMFNCLNNFFLISDIARASPYILIASLLSQCFYGFIDVLYFSANDVNRCIML